MYRPRYSKWQRLITRYESRWILWRNKTNALALCLFTFGSFYYFGIGLEKTEKTQVSRGPLSSEGPTLKAHHFESKNLNVNFNSRLQQWEIFDQNQSLLKVFNGVYWSEDPRFSRPKKRPQLFKFQLPQNRNLHQMVKSMSPENGESFLISHLPHYQIESLSAPLNHILKISVSRNPEAQSSNQKLKFEASPLSVALSTTSSRQDRIILRPHSFRTVNTLSFYNILNTSHQHKNNRLPSSQVLYLD